MSIESRLREIEERANKATPGPWRSDIWRSSINEPRLTTSKIIFGNGVIGFNSISSGEMSALDAEFITASRTDIPKLVSALRVAIDALQNHYAKEDNYYDAVKYGWDDFEANKTLTEIERILEGKE